MTLTNFIKMTIKSGNVPMFTLPLSHGGWGKLQDINQIMALKLVDGNQIVAVPDYDRLGDAYMLCAVSPDRAGKVDNIHVVGACNGDGGWFIGNRQWMISSAYKELFAG